ncbi:MAG: DUF4256 domain-containing protein [Cytophagaceae bacterium]|nr:DUF4256 domain-containing protein [Cytophagaceae bacterium]MBL0302549.1 DUF4256 domain-containing protein [Cytophagaceae bacterium]MBL0325377.1 DUF4256 domain-containing protein [Cytophagaceae bacterium]
MRKLSTEEKDSLIKILKTRFEKNMGRHPGIKWEDVQTKLENNPEKLWSLDQMELTEGEPDVVGFDEKSGEYIFYDCSPESPKGRRSLCYDRAALDARKEYKPTNSIMDMAAEMGVEVLTEEQYHFLQSLGNFDLKTSSWIITPFEIRKRGGALFGDRRYDHVFTYHNGADSYYAARGFRSALKI